MGVQSVSGRELVALATSATSRAPRPRGDFEAKPNDASQIASAASKPREEPARPAQAEPAQATLVSEANGVQFSVDGATNRLVGQIVDEVNQVIKQVPPEELLKVVAKTRWLQGVLFDQEA